MTINLDNSFRKYVPWINFLFGQQSSCHQTFGKPSQAQSASAADAVHAHSWPDAGAQGDAKLCQS